MLSKYTEPVCNDDNPKKPFTFFALDHAIWSRLPFLHGHIEMDWFACGWADRNGWPRTARATELTTETNRTFFSVCRYKKVHKCTHFTNRLEVISSSFSLRCVLGIFLKGGRESGKKMLHHRRPPREKRERERANGGHRSSLHARRRLGYRNIWCGI